MAPVRHIHDVQRRLSLSFGKPCVHAGRIVMSPIPGSKQFQVQQRQAHECDASTTSETEETVCTANADIPLDSVLVWFAVRCLF